MSAEVSVADCEDVSALCSSRYKGEGQKLTEKGGKRKRWNCSRIERKQEWARKTRRIKESKRAEKDKKQTNKQSIMKLTIYVSTTFFIYT